MPKRILFMTYLSLFSATILNWIAVRQERHLTRAWKQAFFAREIAIDRAWWSDRCCWFPTAA
jgi:hypothetical protein